MPVTRNATVAEAPEAERKGLAEEFQLFQKLRGGQMEEVLPDTKIDFARPGIERFVTLPIDQTEG